MSILDLPLEMIEEIAKNLDTHSQLSFGSTCKQVKEGIHTNLSKYERCHCIGGPYDCYIAARAGHLSCLIAAHRNGCKLSKDISEAAAEGGNIHILKYLHKHNCQFDIASCIYAAEQGYLECLRYLMMNASDMNLSDYKMINAAASRNGHLHISKFLYHLRRSLSKDDNKYC